MCLFPCHCLSGFSNTEIVSWVTCRQEKNKTKQKQQLHFEKSVVSCLVFEERAMAREWGVGNMRAALPVLGTPAETGDPGESGGD